MPNASASQTIRHAVQEVDVAVVGAGFAGLYLLHRLRRAGFTAVGLDAADDVGGTWYWNRYPGARCDIQTTDYSYTFDPALEAPGNGRRNTPPSPRSCAIWASSPTATTSGATSASAPGHDGDAGTRRPQRWRLATSTGAAVSCRYYIMASGCLSAPKPPEIDGVRDFKGEITSPAAGRARASHSPASASPSSARDRRASRRSR